MAGFDDYDSNEGIVLLPEGESSFGKELADKMLESALRHRKASKQKHVNLKQEFGNVLTDRRCCHRPRARFSPLRPLTTSPLSPPEIPTALDQFSTR